jgi:hypothetical protein
MFFFANFDRKDAQRTYNYDKGKLFEVLVSELVGSLDYENIDIRVKAAGKEYVVQGLFACFLEKLQRAGGCDNLTKFELRADSVRE